MASIIDRAVQTDSVATAVGDTLQCSIKLEKLPTYKHQSRNYYTHHTNTARTCIDNNTDRNLPALCRAYNTLTVDNTASNSKWPVMPEMLHQVTERKSVNFMLCLQHPNSYTGARQTDQTRTQQTKTYRHRMRRHSFQICHSSVNIYISIIINVRTSITGVARNNTVTDGRRDRHIKYDLQ
jgi:hypothetical protein